MEGSRRSLLLVFCDDYDFGCDDGLCNAILVAGGDEVAEERVRLERLGLELGVELAAEEEGMVGDLDDLDVGGVGGGAGEAKAGAGEDGFVLAVELVAMAVALADLGCAVGLGGEGAGLAGRRPRRRGAWCRPSLRRRSARGACR